MATACEEQCQGAPVRQEIGRSTRDLWERIERNRVAAMLLLAGAALFIIGVVWFSQTPTFKSTAWSLDPLWSGELVSATLLLAAAVSLVAGSSLAAQSRPDLRGQRPLPGGGFFRWNTQLALSTIAFAVGWVELGDNLTNPLNLVAVIVLALAIGYSLYRLLLVRLARGPGPVAILEVTDATYTTEAAPLTELTTVLRAHLASVDLYPQSLVPGASAPHDFVEQVQSASAGKNPVERAVRMLLAPLPTHAYRVQCAALRRAHPSESYGISVQVQLLPRWMSAPAIHWARSWDEALQAGAYSVAETILPWTKQGKRPPWTAWLDEEMPQGLLSHYERGKRLAQARRYDEALGEFIESLRLDPANLQFRMELAHVYQKLALYMDALEMYVHVDELARRRLDDLHWSDWRRKPRALRASLKETQVAAQYRRTIALAWGDLLAQQWVRGRPETEKEGRDRDKHWARARLERPLLTSLHHAMSNTSDEQQPGYSREWEETLSLLIRNPRDLECEPQDPLPEICLRLLFQLLALHSARDHEPFSRLRRVVSPHALWITETSWELIEEWTLYRLSDAYWSILYLLRSGDVPTSHTLSSVEKGLRTSAELVVSELGTHPERIAGEGGGLGEDVSSVVEHQRRGAAARLQKRTQELVGTRTEEGAEQIAPKASGGGSWLDHYNAACTYMAPVTKPDWPQALPQVPGDAKLRPSHVEYAVEELRAAMSKRRPIELVGLAPWVCSEDPDLTAIRADPAFARFAARQFPGRVGEVRRPRDAHLMELALYTTRGGRRAARLIAKAWWQRMQSAPPDASELETLWRQERRAWQSVGAVAERYKHWPTRLHLTQEMDEWARRWEQPAPEWTYPLFDAAAKTTLDDWSKSLACEELKKEPRPMSADKTPVRMWVDCSDERLRRVRSAVGRGSALESLLEDEEKRVSADPVRGLTLPVAVWKELASSHAQLWQCLDDWLSDDCLAEPCFGTSTGAKQCSHDSAFHSAVQAAKNAAPARAVPPSTLA